MCMIMLVQLACLFLISKAKSIDYDVLVADVENTLDECLSIAEDVGRYHNEVNLLQEVTRRVEDKKLRACVRIMTAVGNYREGHTRVARYQDLLRLKEKAYLHELLKPLSKKMGDLLYMASMDGDAISDFSAVYDNESPTLIIVESNNGFVFGGYTDKQWSTSGEWQTSSNAFLFRLRPSFKQLAIKTTQYANFINDNLLQFGNDIRLYDHALSNDNNKVGHGDYELEGYELNGGNRTFQAVEWVAVKVEDL